MLKIQDTKGAILNLTVLPNGTFGPHFPQQDHKPGLKNSKEKIIDKKWNDK